MFDKILGKYWDKKAEKHRIDAEAVNTSKKSQYFRYYAFSNLFDLNNSSILDVGCGLGDFYGFLKKNSIECNYFGVDLSKKMVLRARKKYSAKFECENILNWNIKQRFDYVVSFGIHNNIAEIHTSDLLYKITLKQFELSNKAAHVSILSNAFKGKYDKGIKSWNASEVLKLFNKITPNIVYRHDYMPHDMSFSLVRNLLVDEKEWE